MTLLVNRLHDLLGLCDPEYQGRLPKLTTTTGIAALQAYSAPGSSAIAREREQISRATAAQLELLDTQDRELKRKLERASKARCSSLRQIEGIGPLISCGLIAELGGPRPGFGEEQLAALVAAALLEASSAGALRHRLNRGGNRRLNMFLHQIVLTQGRMYLPAQAYLARRTAEGKTDREARRAVKRLLVLADLRVLVERRDLLAHIGVAPARARGPRRGSSRSRSSSSWPAAVDLLQHVPHPRRGIDRRQRRDREERPPAGAAPPGGQRASSRGEHILAILLLAWFPHADPVPDLARG